MAKELPYFQFEPAEYLTKDISFCSLSAQGLFINLCAYYWQRECKLTKDQLLRRLNHPKELEELISEKVVSINKNEIKVSFLDEQYIKATQQKKTNSINGSKGGRPKKKKPEETETKPKQNPTETETKGIREDKIRKEDIKEEDIIGSLTPSKLPFFFSWLEYRKEIKKEIKNSSTLISLVKRFNSKSDDCCRWVVNHSIENNYQGLFWDKYTESKTVKKRIAL